MYIVSLAGQGQGQGQDQDHLLLQRAALPQFPALTLVLTLELVQDSAGNRHVLKKFGKSIFRENQKNYENSKKSEIFGRLRDRLGDVRGSFSDRSGTIFENSEIQNSTVGLRPPGDPRVGPQGFLLLKITIFNIRNRDFY